MRVINSFNVFRKIADETILEMSRNYDEAARKIHEIWRNVNLGSLRYEEILETVVELVKVKFKFWEKCDILEKGFQ